MRRFILFAVCMLLGLSLPQIVLGEEGRVLLFGPETFRGYISPFGSFSGIKVGSLPFGSWIFTFGMGDYPSVPDIGSDVGFAPFGSAEIDITDYVKSKVAAGEDFAIGVEKVQTPPFDYLNLWSDVVTDLNTSTYPGSGVGDRTSLEERLEYNGGIAYIYIIPTL